MNRLKFRMRLLIAVVACLYPVRPACAQAPAITEEQRKQYLDSFDYVWRTIRDKHWDPKLGGVDWKAAYDEHRPLVEKAQSSAESRSAMARMIDKLGQSHFQIIPGGAYSELTNASGKTRSGRGVPGFDIRVVQGDALVTEVEQGLPAEKAGVKLGWQVLRIDGQDLGPTLENIAATYKGKRELDFQLARAVRARLRGNEGDKLGVVFRNGDGKDETLEIPLVKPRGVAAQFGNLPAMYVHHESRKIDPNIAYFRLTAFFDPENVMKAFEKAVKQNLQADGFILDLRGNPGGIGFLGVGMGGWFVDRSDCALGTMKTRTGPLHFVLNPRLETFTGPLAILVDGLSVSTSEILAGGLQDLKRARVFGTNTAGAALPSQVEKLPSGDGFQYAIADYVSSSGKRLEGEGVRPDVEVRPDRQSLLAGKDPVLDAAVAWIEQQKKKTP